MVGLHTVIPPLRVMSLIPLISPLGMVVQSPATLPHHHNQPWRKNLFYVIGSWHLVGLHTAIPPLRVMSLISLISPLGMVVQSPATLPHRHTQPWRKNFM